MARNYDITYYEKTGRWHFDILLLFEGRAGASSVAFKSEAENRQGYASKEEATKAALAQKAKLPAN
jgi:hypothetical protein